MPLRLSRGASSHDLPIPVQSFSAILHANMHRPISLSAAVCLAAAVVLCGVLKSIAAQSQMNPQDGTVVRQCAGLNELCPRLSVPTTEVGGPTTSPQSSVSSELQDEIPQAQPIVTELQQPATTIVYEATKSNVDDNPALDNQTMPEPAAATLMQATAAQAGCKEIGEKCYTHDECCSKRCHGFLHQCVT